MQRLESNDRQHFYFERFSRNQNPKFVRLLMYRPGYTTAFISISQGYARVSNVIYPFEISMDHVTRVKITKPFGNAE